MKIWLTTIGQRLDNAENTRTFLLARALAERGHDITIWTSSFDHIRKCIRPEFKENPSHYIYSDRITIRFGIGCGYKKNISIKRLIDHFQVAKSIVRQAAKLEKPCLIIASLPDHITCEAIVRYSVSRDIPCIVDVRDKWPDIFIDYSSPIIKPIVATLLFSEKKRVRYAFKNATTTVSMMKSMLLWARKYNRNISTSENKVFYIASSNQNFETSSYKNDDIVSIFNKESKVVFSFTGTFNATQNPQLILEALDYLYQYRPEVYNQVFVNIAGSGQNEAFIRRSASKHLNIKWHGWVSPDNLRSILNKSDVGLLPMTFNSLAFNNKSFSYLSAGIPIINCAEGDLAEIIEQEGIGINIPPAKPILFAQAMEKLVVNRKLLCLMKSNARQQFITRFSPKVTYANYATYAESIALNYRK